MFCDFTIREPNHPKESHRYTVQCVLPFNLFNQQIFTYLYFWLVIISCFNFVSILVWLYRLLPYRNFYYFERRLSTSHASSSNDDDDLKKKFVYRYLQGDGTFMIHLIISNVSDYVCRRIITELYKVFCESLKARTIGREPLFQPIMVDDEHDDDGEDKKQHDNENIDDGDDGSTDQTVAADIPPIPNPRQGRVFIERESVPRLSSEIFDIDENEPVPIDTSSRLASLANEQPRLRSSLIPLLKDIRRASEIQVDSSESTTSPLQKCRISN